MNMFESFVKNKEEHVVEQYCEEEVDGLEENDSGAVREVKKMYVEEIIHHDKHEEEKSE